MGLFGGNKAGSEGAKINSFWQQWAHNGALEALKEDWFKPYREEGDKAVASYSDALGLNGKEGAWKVQDQFANSPGYEFQLDQGLEAINRAGSSRGNLAGGQTSLDLVKYGEGLADLEYDDYLDRLSGLSEIGLKGATGSYTRDKTLADYGFEAADSIGEGWMEGLKSDETANNQGQANLLSGILGGVKLLSGFGK
jgi:hypothetical protein